MSVPPMSLNSALLFWLFGDTTWTSRSVWLVWLKFSVTSRSPIRGLPGMVMVEVIVPRPGPMFWTGSVLVYVVQVPEAAGCTLTLRL